MAGEERSGARERFAKRNQPSALTGIDPPRNFTITTEARVRAMSIGAPAYAERKRRIEDAEDAWLRALVDVHDALHGAGASREATASAMRKKATTFDFARVNKLVVTHNLYYPIEANLPNDPTTGNYLVAGRAWKPESPFDVERVVRTALEAVADRDG